MGRVEPGSRRQCVAIIEQLRAGGPILLPLLDTTALHIAAALRMAL